MAYVAQQGDIVYLDFNPQADHEQVGRRPALIVSNNTFNRFTKAAIVCPITNTNHRIHLIVKSFF
ncbi:MAG: type II toxin-antitoxin system PemK/MazF family toxin [Clostridiales bacterium]